MTKVSKAIRVEGVAAHYTAPLEPGRREYGVIFISPKPLTCILCKRIIAPGDQYTNHPGPDSPATKPTCRRCYPFEVMDKALAVESARQPSPPHDRASEVVEVYLQAPTSVEFLIPANTATRIKVVVRA
jgi:hypothetical protein